MLNIVKISKRGRDKYFQSIAQDRLNEKYQLQYLLPLRGLIDFLSHSHSNAITEMGPLMKCTGPIPILSGLSPRTLADFIEYHLHSL